MNYSLKKSPIHVYTSFFFSASFLYHTFPILFTFLTLKRKLFTQSLKGNTSRNFFLATRKDRKTKQPLNFQFIKRDYRYHFDHCDYVRDYKPQSKSMKYLEYIFNLNSIGSGISFIIHGFRRKIFIGANIHWSSLLKNIFYLFFQNGAKTSTL